MTAILLRFLVYALIAAFVYTTARRLWRDLTGQPKATPQPRFRPRFRPAPPPPGPDIKDTPKADVIELKRGADGVYRPPGEGDR